MRKEFFIWIPERRKRVNLETYCQDDWVLFKNRIEARCPVSVQTKRARLRTKDAILGSMQLVNLVVTPNYLKGNQTLEVIVKRGLVKRHRSCNRRNRAKISWRIPWHNEAHHQATCGSIRGACHGQSDIQEQQCLGLPCFGVGINCHLPYSSSKVQGQAMSRHTAQQQAMCNTVGEGVTKTVSIGERGGMYSIWNR